MKVTLPMLQWPDEIQPFSRWLAEEVKPKTILEIGTGPGGVTQLLSNIASGKTVTVDKIEGSTTGMNQAQTAKRNAALVGVICISGDSHHKATWLKVVEQLDGDPVDMLFIDGDHSLDGVTADVDDYGKLVRSGGWIVFHDINAAASAFEVWEKGGVPAYWAGLAGEKLEWTVRGDWGGIGAWRKP
jgi:predicted O-methyltransferase YrrM